MKSFIKHKLNEAIRASEAYNDIEAVKTVINGKRNLGFIAVKASTIPEDEFWNIINNNGLKTISVPSNNYNAYIYFRQGAEKEANELRDIAEKYGGYLAYNATPEDTRRIGKLLGYEDSDVEDYIARTSSNK